MGSTGFKKRDLRRFSKVYPFVRFEKRLTTFVQNAEIPLTIEKAGLGFVGETSKVYNFTETYSSVPPVVITSVDSANNDQANINAYISYITTTSMTVSTSQTFTGTINLQIIKFSS